jgi:HK97 family phage portal protein
MSLASFLFAATNDSESQIEQRSDAWSGVGSTSTNTKSGETVTPKKCFALSTYFACVRNIAEDIGRTPRKLYRRGERNEKILVTDHAVFPMLSLSPNPYQSAQSFWETLCIHALNWGNGFAEIQTNQLGEIVALNLIHPSRCDVKLSNSGAPELRVTMESGQRIVLDSNEYFHLRGPGDDPLVGWSIPRLAAETIGISLASQNYGAQYFNNSAVPSVVLKHPGKLDDLAVVALRQAWRDRYGGGNKNGVAVLREGMEVQQLSISPEASQFLETREFQVVEIARWFRMPPHLVQDLSRATFSNIEHQSIEYTTNTLGPWYTRIEQEIERKLFTEKERIALDVSHDDHIFLRGDAKSRAEYLRSLISSGVITPNEARRVEEWNPSENPAADELYMQGAMATLTNLANGQSTGKPGEDNNKSESFAIKYDDNGTLVGLEKK